ncbi:tRNA (adenosine(37)-N6)-dimethylallyltransferase MiaA [Subtercola boreus]|uniref:tRNA dimethylallyltransferase n=1 Tax=Subtercola boreus TaxID=120213 RepID=A0A3E0WEE2_9MICO|nr:tRNA (adenosine(37)-N6)-dimethylallyltransferase MiaA [Subtercola boreus]RFA21830.1 tRNA (adenosine(37)-N6)-dimethylallyltransferase MiaA [Subtercola boreus]RFA21941.1 tRNA (adenosine(37)-N6)-dimethylallyltransferase MiaA [Subtercola boreus]RFA27889.1 tRNA (adenosine(37)-N6)-dimethylallyltransferase MiaA [Subtercola boreus]
MTGSPDLVAVVGATGTGKSELSLAIAEQSAAAGRPVEIVNADAMQLYRGMDIGTAKLSVDERRGIPHHLLDVLDVTADGSVADYQRDARAAVNDIIARGALPVLVGGSGLYVSSVIYDFQFPVRDEAVRRSLEAELERQGLPVLFARLADADAGAAASIGPHNARRIIRALEVIELTGRPVSGQLPEEPVWWRPTSIVALRHPRELLVGRLDRRVEAMWQNGLLAEVEALLPLGIERGTTAQRAIGYAQALGELRGTMTQTDAIAEAQSLTRRYARRQVSWFRRYREARWFDADDPGLVAEVVAQVLPSPSP